MKRFKQLLIAVLALVIVLLVAYRLCNTTPEASLPPNVKVSQILNDAGCIMCHSTNANLPFYANYPFAKNLIQQHISNGVRAEDLTKALQAIKDGKPVNEVSLAKIEQCIAEGTMPLFQYYIVHWGSDITPKQKEIILSWAKDERIKNYSTKLAADKFAAEPVQPIHNFLPVDTNKVMLGKMLYNDVRLSIDNTVSCATCHGLNTGGVDNKQYSEGVSGQLGGVNAPTVYNAAYNFVQFWDGRAATLAIQAAGPPLNPIEMGYTSFDEIVAKLQEDKAFTKLFTTIYPDGLSQNNITDAIAEFEKTLITPNSKFDKYLKGDEAAISANELAGYGLFKQNRCATCHVGVNLGGQSYEHVNLYGDYFADRGLTLTNEDNGRFKETKAEKDRHCFKVPGLRNIELTAPYYHDGSMKTLEEAVNAMGKYQLNKTFTADQTNKMVAFLRTLTGEHNGQLLTNANYKAQ
ncbi:MAG: cytochrome c peroxidase [Bacteroidales bacterium]